MRSALRAYALDAADPATALRLLDRKIQYFEPDAMATVRPEAGQRPAAHWRPAVASASASSRLPEPVARKVE
ncbi:MAG TPA: hypothetical protein VH478_18865 [Trebonia sp.]|nr:hypothetical protein [Trebonia sp.]